MNSATEEQTSVLFHALADATRRDILRRSLVREYSVSALAGFYTMSFAAVQKHVAILERAGLLTKRRQGREALTQGKIETVRTAAALLNELEELWRGRVARIDELLAQDNEPGSS